MVAALQRLRFRRAPLQRIGVPNINLLRMEAARQAVAISSTTLLLAILLEVGIGAYIYSQQATEVLAGLPLGSFQGANLEADQDLLQRRVESLTEKLFARRKARTTIFQQFNLPKVITVIFDAAPPGIKVLSIRQSLQEARAVEVGGSGQGLEDINLFRARLLESKVVEGVAIRSVSLRGGEGASFVLTMELGSEARQ